MKRLSIGRRVVGGFAIAYLLLLLSGAQMYRSLQGYDETARWVTHSYKVLDALHRSMLELYDLESRQRAYIITGDTVYLEDNEQALRSIRAALTEIADLTADNPAQRAHIEAHSQLVEERMSLLDKMSRSFAMRALPQPAKGSRLAFRCLAGRPCSSSRPSLSKTSAPCCCSASPRPRAMRAKRKPSVPWWCCWG
ncbi:MAG: CHASE3 domain-containing protein [Rhodoferax sp.]|nr:CHASE3 domain-containing protein [Rhodoferax sp.]